MDNKDSVHKDEKTRLLIKDLAANFVQRESNRASIVTVTDVQVFNKAKNAVVLFTVLPRDKEGVVEEFLKRKRAEFQMYVRSNSRIGRIPFFDFEIDHGEKNRQRIDHLINMGTPKEEGETAGDDIENLLK